MLQGLAKAREIIGVMGGSIGGLSAAIILQKLGHDVTILERTTRHEGKGAGIALPEDLVRKCIALDLFDPDIPCLRASSRTFFMKDEAGRFNVRNIWEQPVSLRPFNWQHIYANLRKRFPDERYHCDQEVIRIEQDGGGCIVRTNNKVYEFDRVIAADGVGSFVRKAIFPKISPEYTDYIAWRGIIDDADIVKNNFFSKTPVMCVFPNGHLVLYQIPAEDYLTSGKTVLNWVMYEYRKGSSIKTLLTDKEGIQHAFSLPPGKLSEKQISHLQILAWKVLPGPLASIICQTKKPFMQAIFDFQAPTFVKDRICLLGDAATGLRPHTASGLVRALEGSISLGEAMNAVVHPDREAALLEWNNSQIKLAQTQSALAKLMGQALVTDPPNWVRMDKSAAECWWQSLMEGKKWYVTSPAQPLGNKFTPLHEKAKQREIKEAEALCADFNTMSLLEQNSGRPIP